MPYSYEAEFMARLTREAWDRCADIEPEAMRKGAFDCVTRVDLAMEEYITRRIREAFPGDVIIGEEFNPLTRLPDGRVWTVDPIDGTVNMSHGLGLFGVQCAFVNDGVPSACAILLPRFDELYTACAGEGAALNGAPISVVAHNLESAVISAGDYSHKTPSHARAQLRFVANICGAVGKLRHFGAASVDFAWLAAGRTDGFTMITGNLWDLLPGIVLVSEAGGFVTDLNGESYAIGAEGVIASASEEIGRVMAEAYRERK